MSFHLITYALSQELSSAEANMLFKIQVQLEYLWNQDLRSEGYLEKVLFYCPPNNHISFLAPVIVFEGQFEGNFT